MSRMEQKYCICDAMASMGEVSPRIWECEEHGKTGFAGFHIMWLQQTAFPHAWEGAHPSVEIKQRDEFWFFCRGVLARQKALYRANGKIYFDEDHLWSDVQTELVKYFGKEALLPTNPDAVLGPRAFGVPDAPQTEELPKPRGGLLRLFRG